MAGKNASKEPSSTTFLFLINAEGFFYLKKNYFKNKVEESGGLWYI